MTKELAQRTERDPNGIDPHKPGAKLDAGKERVGLMLSGFARALLRVAAVTTYGANKYTPNAAPQPSADNEATGDDEDERNRER